MNSNSLYQDADFDAFKLATLSDTGILKDSLNHLIGELEQDLTHTPVVPDHGEAGSYEHNTHKRNGTVIEHCGQLFQLTNDPRYLERARTLLLSYAEKYLKLPFQQAKNTNPPGRLFHQILNEQMWLLSTSLGYDCVKQSLSEDERNIIESQLFHPMIHIFTEIYDHDFDRIHNHGLWAVAAVGICSLVVDDDKALQKCIFGLDRSGQEGGFLAQIDQLFSSSGYYIEGPYYHRFAIYPLCIFAQALHTHRPDLNIFERNNQVIKRSISALLMSAYPDGRLPALNDASLTMNISDIGIVIAASIYRQHFGPSSLIAETAKLQGRVWLHPSCLQLAQEADAIEDRSNVLWPSIELSEGRDGSKGGLGILRSKDKHGHAQQLMMNYGQHGLDHGHFDALGVTYFHRDREVLRDYGFCRWVNVETKFGGRYLPENKTWARQTIAHNTVTVDENSQNRFDQRRADQRFGQKHFFYDNRDTNVQAVSAFANQHYDGVRMQRTLIHFPLGPEETKVIVDVFRLSSEALHQYDYALHHRGNITDCSPDFTVDTESRHILGRDNGYQHLWKNAEANCLDQEYITWLDGSHFQTWLAETKNCRIFLAESGANDPDFNLRREPCFILRAIGHDHSFVSALETHGIFDESTERCSDSKTSLQKIQTIVSCDTHTIIELKYRTVVTDQNASDLKTLQLLINNRLDCQDDTVHQYRHNEKTYCWTGNLAVEYL